MRWLEEVRLPARLVRRDGTAILTAGWPAGVTDHTEATSAGAQA